MSTAHHVVSQKPRPTKGSRRYSLAELVDRRITNLRTTAQALSRKSGVSPSIISRILDGSRKTIEHDTVMRLAKALGLEWSRFYTAMRVGKERKLMENNQEAEAVSARA